MKLWLLKPISTGPGSRWSPWYDKSFGFVIRAETEAEARAVAEENSGDESRSDTPAWTDPVLSTCLELTAEGAAELILQDFHAA